MITRIWKRDEAHHIVIEFKKGTGAVSTKGFKTHAGAMKGVERLIAHCGEAFEKADLPWETYARDTGVLTRHFQSITFNDKVKL